MNKAVSVFKVAVTLQLISMQVAIAGTSVGSIIYGSDNRKDTVELKNDSLIEASKAVAARIDKWSYKKNDISNLISFEYAPLLSDDQSVGVCKDERFASQVSLSDCTGFLIGKDLLVTAGHCITDPNQTVKNNSNYYCRENEWLFNYEVDSKGKFNLDNISAKNIYKCKNVVYATLTEKDDFAIIQLDRPVIGVKPLKIRKSGKIKTNEDIFVIGHPSGMPKKFADGAKVRVNKRREFFSTNLDTFGGSSGSPVFNAQTLEVEGILVRGKTDYIDSDLNGQYCMRVNTCDNNAKKCKVYDSDIDGEQVTRISEIIRYLK
jgi:V8-like Glu-specific endopeptidase